MISPQKERDGKFGLFERHPVRTLSLLSALLAAVASTRASFLRFQECAPGFAITDILRYPTKIIQSGKTAEVRQFGKLLHSSKLTIMSIMSAKHPLLDRDDSAEERDHGKHHIATETLRYLAYKIHRKTIDTMDAICQTHTTPQST